MSWWLNLLDRFKGQRISELEIRVVPGGFELVSTNDQTVTSAVRWKDISRIQTYKIDLVTMDCICLLFEFPGEQAPLEILEEWSGFNELLGPLAEAFPSVPEGWYAKVMQPPFEENRVTLFEKAA